MTDQLIQIANRIRELREISGVTLETMAHDLGVSHEQYVEYESGTSDIPVGVLYQFASKFNVELTEILTGDAPKLHAYSLVRNGKGMSVERRKEYKYQSLAYNFIHKKAEPFLVTVDPVPADSEVHYNSHPGQEFNYVLEGSLMVIINGHEITMHEGDSLFFDSTFQHGMKTLEERPAKFLAIVF